MRYYDIALYSGSNPIPANEISRYRTIGDNGQYDPTALRVEFDISAYNSSTPAGLSFIRIYGINYQDMVQGNNLNPTLTEPGAKIVMKGGMMKGLPLADPAQQGVLLSGNIYQAFGNWQGTEISLDLIAAPPYGTEQDPLNFTSPWNQGDTLEQAVRNVLLQAFPTIKNSDITGSFSPDLIAVTTLPFQYSTLDQFAAAVLRVSKTIITDPAYLGAQIVQTPNGFYLYDASNLSALPVKQLNFIDFIGNATWQGFGEINFKTVLRGDLAVGMVIRMPPRSNIVNALNSYTQYRDRISFQNNFIISRLRHVGNSRQPSADNWCTVVDAILIQG
jgi:hypothetical protein